MQMSLENMELKLEGKKQFAFREARGVELECTEGKVWLTVEGQPGDFLLGRGERVRIESNGLALVQGMPSASIRLVSEAIRSVTRQYYFASGLLISNQM
jgi:uncharacterized protein (AIM24 family)